MTDGLMSHSLFSFGITSTCSHKAKPSKALQGIEVIVLPINTMKIPAFPIVLDLKWKHLHGLNLADLEFGVTGLLDILVGTDVFSCIIRHGLRSRPAG